MPLRVMSANVWVCGLSRVVLVTDPMPRTRPAEALKGGLSRRCAAGPLVRARLSQSRVRWPKRPTDAVSSTSSHQTDGTPPSRQRQIDSHADPRHFSPCPSDYPEFLAKSSTARGGRQIRWLGCRQLARAPGSALAVEPAQRAIDCPSIMLCCLPLAVSLSRNVACIAIADLSVSVMYKSKVVRSFPLT